MVHILGTKFPKNLLLVHNRPNIQRNSEQYRTGAPWLEHRTIHQIPLYFILKLKLFSFQNFSVCKKCSRLGQLFHRLTHQKHRMFNMCSEVVEGRKKSSPAYDTTKILNELLANDAWLEQVNKTKLTTTNDIIAGNVWERFIIATLSSDNIF